ncbi:MAG TPA: FAD-dependent oxidoreductase [Actinomycetes bacterium]|nr:FAD-dependent oxidoreductase [Actinomycetes bacterium]
MPVRACVVGGGLAGAMLLWRLAGRTRWELDLFTGGSVATDATSASGGAVRGYERHREQRRLAALSMVELRSSRTLRRWARFRPVDSVYLRSDADGVDTEIAEVEARLPGSVSRGSPADLAARGWAGVPDAAVAVLERTAGYTSPAAWRAALLADRSVRRRVSVHTDAAAVVTPTERGSVVVTAAGQHREYDAVVVAAGAWTPALLRSSGLPAGGYRTKSIQYGVYATSGWRPPQFVDEISQLYGRPTSGGGLLLGLPTDRWDVDPDRPPIRPGLTEAAARLARTRFPALRLGPLLREASAADCYADEPVLCLRPVVATGQLLATFSGGAGGSVKTVLAASRLAADQLVSGLPGAPPVGQPSVGHLRGRSQP